MKISASIYSDKIRPLNEVIKDLESHQVDLLHVDCNDDLNVFSDIKKIREWCSIPIDLHIITSEPEKYFDLLIQNPVEYVTFQYEDLKNPLVLPKEIKGKKGLAIITPTSVEVFDSYANFDFILIMATIPGQSGGVFDKVNFSKIRQFRKKYPAKSIHVDGGVNGEVSFILRNMGVSSSVSGSYLFNAPSIGHALMNLTKREIESHYCVEDFMIPLSESPIVNYAEANIKAILEAVENGNYGFALVIGNHNKLVGLVSSADIRKAWLKKINQISAVVPDDLINKNPKSILAKTTVFEMLQLIKKSSFPVMYLPVVDENQNAVGIVNFVHLIKGEI